MQGTRLATTIAMHGLCSVRVRNGVEPNAFTLSSALKGCKSMRALSYGALVHGLAVKLGMKESMYVNNALMDMYATCCVSMDEACMVFQEINAKNAVGFEFSGKCCW